MFVRISLAMTLAVAAGAGQAAGQYFPGAPSPYYQPYSPPPPDDIEDIIDDPAVESAPLPAPPVSRSFGASTYSRDAGEPEAQRAYGDAPPTPGQPRDDWRRGLRPPADIEDTTGAVSAVPGAPPGAEPAAPVSLLPPEYQPEEGEPKELPPHLRRQLVDYPTKEPAGTLIIDTPNTYLYLMLGDRKAMRYGIGVGREGFTWSGRERISKMAEWPDWNPPPEMIERQPYLPRFMAGGATNPLGARALYLGKTLFRIHGTNQPSTIGTFVSSGCIRLVNEDIEDLYGRVSVGTRVVVLPGKPPEAAARQTTQTR